jgi:hypothetical protein
VLLDQTVGHISLTETKTNKISMVAMLQQIALAVDGMLDILVRQDGVSHHFGY